MSKKDNGLFNFPSNSRAKQERVSFEKGGKVEKASRKVEYAKTNPGDTTKKTKKKKKPYYKSPEWEMKKERIKLKTKGFSEKKINDMMG